MPLGATALTRVEVSKTVRAFLDSIRPAAPRIRAKLDYGFRYHRLSVELIEIRPVFNNPTKKTEHVFAKATFIKSQGVWKVYWMRGNLKWHPYEPSTVETLDGFLRLVKDDKHHGFFG